MKNCIIVFCVLLISGCSEMAIRPSYRLKALFTPAYLRSQIFNNTPTGDTEAYYSDGTKYDKNISAEEKDDLIRKHIMDDRPIYNIPKDNSAIRQKVTSGNRDSYGQGYEDGCATMSSIIGSGTFRLIKEKIDGYKLSYDDWYLRGFQDALDLCTFSFDWETH